MNLASWIIVAAICAGVALSVRSIWRSGGSCAGCSGCGMAGGRRHKKGQCPAAGKMVSDIERMENEKLGPAR